MTLRAKISLFLILISLIGVFGSSFFVLQNAVIDKKNYVTELSSVLGPQIKSNLDEKFKLLLINTNEFAEFILINNTKNMNFKNFEQKLAGVDAVFLKTTDNKFLAISLAPNNTDNAQLTQISEALQKTIINQSNNNQFVFFHNKIFIFKTSHNQLGAVLLNDDFFKSAFELARGKKTFIINSIGNKIIGNTTELHNFQINDQINLNNLASTDLYLQEVKDTQGQNYLAHFSPLKYLNDSFVLIVSPHVSWLDLTTPLMKSSVSLLSFLILISVLISVYLSQSLARPIEELIEKTSVIGKGEWHKIEIQNSYNEINNLTVSFNNMIKNLQKREIELKEAHHKIIQSESLAAVGRMSAGIAHEVKNPLSSVLGYGQLLELNLKNIKNDGLTDSNYEKFKNYTSLILEDTRRASKIITDLLTFSRQKIIDHKKHNAYEVCQQYLNKLNIYTEAQQFQLQLTNQINPSLQKIFFNIDSEQIYQVLFNLVQNSIHSLNQLSVENKKLTLVFDLSDNFVELSVIDNGQGIPQENLSKVFEPFFTTKAVGVGTGLGLAICYGIILQHQGVIEVSSEPLIHTCFKIKLPIAD